MDLTHYASQCRVDNLSQRLARLGIRFANSAERQAKTLIRETLNAIPLLGLHEEEIPYGPEVHYSGWSEPHQPVCQKAELWLCLPDGSEELVCSSDDQPDCLVYALAATSSEGEVYELADVGSATHSGAFGGRKLKERVALASHHLPLAAQLETLVDRNAAGLLLAAKAEAPLKLPVEEQLPSQILPATRPFLFRLEDTQFDRLRSLLAAEIGLKVRVVIQLEEASETLSVIGADLAGASMDNRVVLLAEYDSPWLPILIEVARVLSEATLDGTLKPSKQKISFVFCANAHAMQGWLAKHAPKTRSITLFEAQPGFFSVFDESYQSLLWRRRGEGGLWRSVPYASANDEQPLTRVSFDRHFGGPDLNRDGQLKKRLNALAMTILEWANLGEGDFPRLLNELHLDRHQKANQTYSDLRRQLAAVEGHKTEARHLLWLSERVVETHRERTQRLIAACQALAQAPAESALRVAELEADLDRNTKALHRSFAAEIRSHATANERTAAKRRSETALDRRAAALIVHPHLEGLYEPKRLLADLPLAEARWLTRHLDRLADQPTGPALMSYFDGKVALFEVVKGLEVDSPTVDLRLLWRYLEVLQAADRIRLETRSTITSATANEVIGDR